jgi:transposase-like protein
MLRTTRRNVRPEPFWRDLIDRWRASGQSIAAFCADHNVGQATFYAWRRRLAARPRATSKPAPAFAAVRVIPDPTAEVVLPSGLVVRVPIGTDPATVARLVVALGGGAC